MQVGHQIISLTFVNVKFRYCDLVCECLVNVRVHFKWITTIAVEMHAV